MGGGFGTRTAARSTATTCSSRRSRTSEPPQVQKNTSPSPSPARRRIPWCVGAFTSRASVSSSYRASHTGEKSLVKSPPPKRIPQSKKSRLTVPGPALNVPGHHMPPRNVAVRRASGAPTLRESLTAFRCIRRKTDAMPPATTTKKMTKMMPSKTHPQLPFNGAIITQCHDDACMRHGATARPRQVACLREGHGTDLARRPPGSPFVPTGERNEDSHGHGRHPPWPGLLAQADRRLASKGSAGVRREAMLGARYVARREPKVPLTPLSSGTARVTTGRPTPRVWPVSFLVSYIYVHRRRSACTAAR